jgi:purine nucleoside phosphorylase
MLGLITGSGFYDLPGLEESRTEEVSTPYGSVHLTLGTWNGCPWPVPDGPTSAVHAVVGAGDR